MIDISIIRKNNSSALSGLKKRGVANDTLDKVVMLDTKRRKVIQKLETIQANKNKFNKKIGSLPKNKKEKKLKEMEQLSEEEKDITITLKRLEEDQKMFLATIPNIPHDSVHVGKEEADNKVIKTVDNNTKKNVKPFDYLQLATKYDLIDTERAAKVSGSRFGYLKKQGAILWNAVVQYTLSILLEENFIPFYSPALVKKDVMENTGYDSYLEGQEAYYIEKDELFLVGTGEHALLPYHAGEILPVSDLPLYYTTYSTCFRREAGSYGKDTKGILRVHQFDKQEMLVITTPDKSWQEFDRLIAIQEKIVQGLKLPYQLLQVCTGDLPKPSAKVVDLECWIPSEGKYRETHSASNCTDYQARNNNIRYKDKDGNNKFVHILNATAITPRILIAILENYQQADGAISIPSVLQPYCQSKKIQ